MTCYFAFPDTPELKVDSHVKTKIGKAFPAAGNRYPVPFEKVNDALDLLVALEPQPTNRWGMAPVWLRFSCGFAVKRPDGEVWPDQDPTLFGSFETPTGVRLGTSFTNLSLQAKRSMALLLSVPNASDTDLVELVPSLQSDLPFQLSRKHWSRWTLTNNGRTYRGRRLLL